MQVENEPMIEHSPTDASPSTGAGPVPARQAERTTVRRAPILGTVGICWLCACVLAGVFLVDRVHTGPSIYGQLETPVSAAQEAWLRDEAEWRGANGCADLPELDFTDEALVAEHLRCGDVLDAYRESAPPFPYVRSYKYDTSSAWPIWVAASVVAVAAAALSLLWTRRRRV